MAANVDCTLLVVSDPAKQQQQQESSETPDLIFAPFDDFLVHSYPSHQRIWERWMEVQDATKKEKNKKDDCTSLRGVLVVIQ
jgi:hypothetical protein